MAGRPRSPIEQWFIQRGLPHLVERGDTAAEVWARAVPLLAVAYVLGGLNALQLRSWSASKNLLVAAAVLVIVVVTWAVSNVVRHRRPFARPTSIGTPELAVFLLAPVLPSLVFNQVGDAVQSLLAGMIVLAVIYVGTSYGAVPLMAWAARRSKSQVGVLARMVVRALPLLLMFTTFLFINAEVWQVAGTLDGPVYWATLGIFFVLGAVFVLSQIPEHTDNLATFHTWDEVRTLVQGTPAADISLPTNGNPAERPLTRRQRWNLGLVGVFSQALQITFIAVLLAAFFTVFGVLAIPTDIASAWTGVDNVKVLAAWTVGGRTLSLNEPLLRVAGFLGAFSGMYFTVVVSTDDTYRREFAHDVDPEIRQALAVRAADRSQQYCD